MKVTLEIPDPQWKTNDIVRIRYGDGQRVVMVINHETAGKFVVRNGVVEADVDTDRYVAVTQAGSTYTDGAPMMPGTVCVLIRKELDDKGEPASVEGEPMQPITDSDEYRRRLAEWVRLFGG